MEKPGKGTTSTGFVVRQVQERHVEKMYYVS